MGTADFAVPVLASLVEAGHDVVAVYAQPPRPAGRGHRRRRSPVHAWAEKRGLPVLTPKSLEDPAEQAAFAALGPDACVVCAYGLILPRRVLDVPRLGCLNVHASLLPRWRGAAPIQRALLAGDSETGVTIMQMDEGLDTGPILLAEKLPIAPDATAGALHDALSRLGARLITEALDRLAAGELTPTPQPKEGVSYAAKLGREEGRLDWRRPAAELERRVRALNPWPGTWFETEREGRTERIKVLAAEAVAGDGPPGTVLDDRLAIACAEGALRPTRVQRPGREPMETEAFLRGHPLPPGTRLR